MNENKNNDIKFEDLVDNYTYQQNNSQENGNAENGNNEAPQGQAPIWSNPQPEAPKNSGYNIACLILGIISIVCCCFYGVVSLICGPLAIVFYVISKKRGTANGMALAGLICAIFGIVVGVVYLIYVIAIADVLLEMFPELMDGTTLEL